MGKYKDGTKSTLISSIPPEKMRDACKEWANGNETMAELLYTCYKNGLETYGNHFGPMSYVDFFVNNSQKVIQSIFNYIQDIDTVQVLISPDGGNPLANEEAFWKSSMAVGFGPIDKKEDLEEIIRGMTLVINDSKSKEEEIEGAFTPLLDIHDFFSGKGSNLKIRTKFDNGKYRFSIEHIGSIKKDMECFKEIFEKAGLNYEGQDLGNGLIINEWVITSDKKEEFKEKLIKAEEIIEANWTYKKPTQIQEDMGFNEKARIKMEQCGKTPEGIEKFKQWLEVEKQKMYRRMNIQEAVSNAINKGTTTEQVQEADTIENRKINQQNKEGMMRDD